MNAGWLFLIVTGSTSVVFSLIGIESKLWDIRDELRAARREAREARFAPRPR